MTQRSFTESTLPDKWHLATCFKTCPLWPEKQRTLSEKCMYLIFIVFCRIFIELCLVIPIRFLAITSVYLRNRFGKKTTKTSLIQLWRGDFLILSIFIINIVSSIGDILTIELLSVLLYNDWFELQNYRNFEGPRRALNSSSKAF